ncbi:multicopper oxidase domain-containing protein [Ornithinimicrobium cerasi]|uniref:Multicopper oxidase n=1 Tax=Ornithinimicrobium cerasi TaxID=2248773 RepID=A0A285VKM7_9MICO|nr:multicopper oxidase domain-containing protein [Ornithinimicrobium cerasi]SOC54640.1 Multicopper oxidase [Ornithinimicrobium cerasi]
MTIRSGVAALATLAVLSVGAGNVSATAGPPGISDASSSGVITAPTDDPADDLRRSYEQKAAQAKEKKEQRITQEDREAAAARALQDGALNPLMVAAAADPAAPGEAPRYFSHPNYANSPLPDLATTPGAETVVGNPLQDRLYATDAASDVLVVLSSPLTDGFLTEFRTWNQANPDAGLASAGKTFHAYVLRPTGSGEQHTVIFDSGALTVPTLTDPAVGEMVTWPVANLPVQTGDLVAWYGQGIPLDVDTGTDSVRHPVPAAAQPIQDGVVDLADGASYPVYPQDRTYSFAAATAAPDQTTISGGIRKFVDDLTTPDVAVPDTTTYPGSDYYEIGLVEYEQQLHSDLPPTTLRGYVQLNGGTGEPSYLGPAIVAQKDRPVRITFRNQLPTGLDGNLFLPVDTTVMGSGMTADGHEATAAEPGMVDGQNPMCTVTAGDGSMKIGMVQNGHCYAENRATLHLHGGITPWISDGTPHQWITPADEGTAYPEGVSVENVPDMPDPGPGAQTFFYTNAQSARLMFYHDHAWGITRLNVYAGEAAPYIITDATEAQLVADGVLPGAADTIPLVFQDKTFVPDAAQLAEQDETWNSQAWGDEGDLWLPHVYSPAQNPGDASGVNAYGRWAYGPWFWPPTQNVEFGPEPNPYYDAACDPDLGWCEPELMPGTPYNSMGMEAFMDTPVVNGTAYPTTTLEAKPYRFRILNAANDRFFNLSLYQAVDADGVTCDADNPTPVAESTLEACTEVALNPAEVEAALTDTTVFPTPVAGTEGPDWLVVGTEGGFLPAPVEVPAHPTTWVNDPTVFNAGNVDQHSLLVAPAERFDVVVDLTDYAGQTLIVYNDAPAAFPARDARYDYYTGNADLRDSGGAPSTLPGYGPNTRTLMQIKVEAPTEPAAAFDLTALQDAFAHQADGSGVFESGQKPIIVGQGAYNSAYGTAFQANGPLAGLVQIFSTALTFDRLVDPDLDTTDASTIEATAGAPFGTSDVNTRLTMNLRPKMIQDEMGEAFEHEYGRMSGFLGVETPNAQAGLQNMILSPYTSPPTEILDGVELPPGMEATPLSTADDGSQIWKFTHNGVDTHPIHFHLYDVQLLNRVGWDGIVRKPEATELGWKDTVRISPLEDTIVALRPIIPPVPDAWEGLPNSIRLIDPSMPEGAWLANTTAQEAAGLPIFAFNPDGEPIDIRNHYVNFGWEYVLHCHILSHEEMDMMHAQVVGIAPEHPDQGVTSVVGNGRNRANLIAWTDTSKNETAFVVERRVRGSAGAWTTIATVDSETLGVLGYVPGGGEATGDVLEYRDVVGTTSTLYDYQVYAVNTVGDVWDYSNPNLNEIPAGGGFPTLTLDSRGGAGQPSVTTVNTPSETAATAVAAGKKRADVTVTWKDNSTNETGFLVQRSTTANFSLNVVNATVASPTVSLTQSLARGQTYYYRVLAFNDTHQSAWSSTATVTTP